MPSTPDFATAYRKLVTRIFGAPTREDGVAEAALLAAEKRLRKELPDPLRALYLVAGKHPSSKVGAHRLLSPEKLCVQNGALIFSHERQDVVRYGCASMRWARPIRPWFRGAAKASSSTIARGSLRTS